MCSLDLDPQFVSYAAKRHLSRSAKSKPLSGGTSSTTDLSLHYAVTVPYTFKTWRQEPNAGCRGGIEIAKAIYNFSADRENASSSAGKTIFQVDADRVDLARQRYGNV